MRIFACPVCRRVVYFDNLQCLHCQADLGFSREDGEMMAVVEEKVSDESGVWLRCRNTIAGCNWLVRDDVASRECFSCELTRNRPEEGPQDLFEWLVETSRAKRWLIYQLDQLGLPIVSHIDQPDGGLAFDLDATTDDKKVMIGHLNGVITIDLTEAQDSHREALRDALGEAYRTMLGHFRHEIGHYYWQVSVAPDETRLEEFREVFGDEQQDYGRALTSHYASSRDDWRSAYISQYATTHPWEDFAETFAHYLHITGSLESAANFGLTMSGPAPHVGADVRWESSPAAALREGASMRDILRQWQPLALALNQANRSLGKKDLYPFAIAEPVVGKLEYVHELACAVAAAAVNPVRRARSAETDE